MNRAKTTTGLQHLVNEEGISPPRGGEKPLSCFEKERGGPRGGGKERKKTLFRLFPFAMKGALVAQYADIEDASRSQV